MSIWIKICGIREIKTLHAVIEAGVDAVGFVFAESVRQITPTEARLLVEELPSNIATVGVFLRPSQVEVNRVIDCVELDFVQADWHALSLLELPSQTKPLAVVREADDSTALPRQFLFEGAKSGQGEISDWQLASQLARQNHLILAGGLSPQNVADAIATVKPFGVDVSSGVESERGIKDAQLINEFVEQARQVSVQSDTRI